MWQVHAVVAEGLYDLGWFFDGTCPTSSAMDTWTLLTECHRRLPKEAVFACATAAWLHGLNGSPTQPVDIIMPPGSSIRSRRALTVRRSKLAPREVTRIRDLPATTLHRTVRDIALFHPRLDAVAALDAALCKKLTTKALLLMDPVTARGRRGARRLRHLIELAEPAESPMETRLRWLLLEACLPRPQVQAELREKDGTFLGRADLYYSPAHGL